MVFHSIRWRLQIWHGLILVLVLAGFGFTAHRLQRGNEMRRVDQELQQRLGPLLNSQRRPPPGDRPDGPPPGSMDNRPEEERGVRPPDGGRRRDNFAQLFDGEENPFYFVIWNREGVETKRSANAPVELMMPKGGAFFERRPSIRMRGEWRELYEVTPPGDCFLVGRSIAPEDGRLRHLALWLSILGGGVLTLGLAGGWWMAGRAIRPIDEITQAAVRIANGDLSHRISATDTDSELGRLAAVLNSTFARLDAAFTQQARFTSDASHELRTPVTVILSQTQTTLARERSATDYRATLEACQRAAQRMRCLIKSLLQLARFDAGQESFKQKPCDLADMARESIDLLRPLADEKGVMIGADLTAARCMGDSERLAQVIANLVSNAVIHNRIGGEVRVETRLEPSFAVIKVTDTGPGISPDDLPRVFERFYRADQSRTAATGGTGLGLAISKAIVEAHGGSIQVSSALGSGACFTVRIPAAV